MELILGIDDVTRCPVIGSLICVGVVVRKDFLEPLKRLGVKDSKVFNHKQILKMAPLILKLIEDYKSVFISAEEISKSTKNYNLNDMECNAFCSIASELNTKHTLSDIQINNFDKTRDKFIDRAEKLGFKFDWSKWTIEHENETRDVAVGAASIIAKSLSIKEFEKFKKQYGDFGSGNPGDKKTLEFVKQKLKEKRKCKIIRYNWKTVKRLI